jgi:hypothetical protein
MNILFCSTSNPPKPYFYFDIKDLCSTWIIMPSDVGHLDDIKYKSVKKIIREKYRVPDTTYYGISVFKEV